MKAIVAYIITVIVAATLSYLATAGILWVAIWALNGLGVSLFAWSWQASLYIWVLWIIAKAIRKDRHSAKS